MDLPDAVTTILALLFVTATFFLPPPTPLDATGPGTPDPVQPQPVAAQNLSSVLVGVQERLQDGHLLNFTSGSPTILDENETEPQVENSTPDVIEYDDDELVRLVEDNSVSLMLLSLQNMYALYAWDEKLAQESGAELQKFAAILLGESAGLDLSDDGESLKASFTAALELYEAAGRMLQGDTPLNSTIVDGAFEANRQGSNHLREAFGYLQHPVLDAPEEIVAVTLSLPPVSAGSASWEELALMQRYVYEDRYRANDISLMLESARFIRVFHMLDGQGNMVAAEPGRMFLLVEVKVTNLGHKGDNRVYTIRTPALKDFTLRYRGTTYAPMTLAPGTSLGEPYAAATLNRYEVKKGYVVFDVPMALTLDESSVQVKLDGASPVWALGKTP
ncbi:DUF4352 domain-containing protein [Methanoculleus sp. Afa-1]|uniref:DUF4352 domain-containing protein n=1 Tax=Methanoculleus formosensis TaxID=2590886 RepID=A0A9E5DG31_9EURY|nr:DUF4352 domain-containing protein [Methanoculleus sp. Afa-1]MCT8338325.1 DUF4352 domain-containing protein [Methanoculleus sp. Afa-1]